MMVFEYLILLNRTISYIPCKILYFCHMYFTFSTNYLKSNRQIVSINVSHLHNGCKDALLSLYRDKRHFSMFCLLFCAYSSWLFITCLQIDDIIILGYMAGLAHKATGSGSNYLCLTNDPHAASFPEDWDFLPGILSGMG